MSKNKFIFKYFSIISVTDEKGNLVSWSSCGRCGFKGSRKKTGFAAQVSLDNALKSCIEQGLKKVNVILSGAGRGRESILRYFKTSKVRIIILSDRTLVSHNGCRPKKKKKK